MNYTTAELAKKIGKTPQTVRNLARDFAMVPGKNDKGALIFTKRQAERICSYYGVQLEHEKPRAEKPVEQEEPQVEEPEPQVEQKENEDEKIRALRSLVEEQLNELVEKDRQMKQQAAKHKEEVENLKAQVERAEKALETQIGITSRLQDLLDKRGDEVRRHLDNTNKLIEQLTQANQAIVAMSTVQAAALAPVGHRTFGQRVKAALAAFRGENEEQA